jgi:hypothetical protein
MKIAYIILAYDSPEQVVRLVRRLSTPDTSFFIHVDKRTDDGAYERMAGPLSACANVRFLRRYRCHWADFGMVRATLAGIREILASDVRQDYVILLSGHCYPTKSNQRIQETLQRNAGRSFITYSALPDPHARQWEARIAYWHVNWWRWHFVFPQAEADFHNPHLRRLWRMLMRWIPLRRKFPGGLKPFQGGTWWCLSRECAEYVSEFVQQNKAFVRFFTYTSTPDELFFQTILLNSPFRDTLVNDDLRYIVFGPKQSHPNILGTHDFAEFMSTGDLFARKFDMTVDGQVLDLIDREIS